MVHISTQKYIFLLKFEIFKAVLGCGKLKNR